MVTYEDKPDAHLQIEYAFDVEEVAKGNFASEAYHDFIGFNVAKPLLQRAFRETYGFEVSDMFVNFDRAVGSYRHTLSTLIPFFTRVAWAEHEKDIRKAHPGVTRRQFLYVMRRSAYEREWGREYDLPTAKDRFLAFLVKLLPPVGHLRTLKFKVLTPPVEQLFVKSFGVATKQYADEIRAAGNRSLRLENVNFDVGVATSPGGYRLQDVSYAYWLDELAKHNFANLPPEIVNTLLNYYSDPNSNIDTKKHAKDWQRVSSELEQLRAAQRTAAQ